MNKKFLSAILFGAVAVASTGSFVSCKDYDDDIDNLQTQINGLASAKDVEAKLGTLQSAISSAQSAAEAKAAAAQTAADAAKAAAEKAGADAADVKKAVEAALADLEAKGATKDELAEVKKIAEAAATKEELAEGLQKAIDAADEAKKEVKTLSSKLSELEEAIKKVADEEAVKAVAAKAGELEKQVNTVSEKLGIISKRPTSLVFAPKTYINGIEAIEFKSLQYVDWGTNKANWEMDAPSGYALNAENKPAQVIDAKDDDDAVKKGAYLPKVEGKYVAKAASYIVGDNKTTVDYYVSPSKGVSKDAFTAMTFLFNEKATNATRADESPVKVLGWTVEDGKLSVNVEKVANKLVAATGNPHATGADKSAETFTIVALKSTLSESVLTEEEKGKEVNLFSDWARVQESILNPRIANSTLRNAKGVLDCKEVTADNDHADHFWAFTTIYNASHNSDATKVAPTQRIYKNTEDVKYSQMYIAKNQLYTEPLDLYSLVTVCSSHAEVDWKAYGLDFEFNLMDYNFLNENETKDFTPQQKFAKLEGSILTSCSRDGVANNQDAIDRTPVIQAVLKDTKNNAVVDVRYFKVRWVKDLPAAQVWKEIEVKSVPFDCVKLEQWIGEEPMNYLYTHIVEGGMIPATFHTEYNKIFTVDGRYPAQATGADPVFADNAAYSFFAYNYLKGEKDGNKYDAKEYSAEEIMKLIQTGNKAELEKLAIGFAKDLTDDSKFGQTHNVLITVDPSDKRIKPSEEKDYTVKGVFAFVSGYTDGIIVVPATLDVKAGTVKYAYNYLSTQWEGNLVDTDKEKYRPVNPTLESDKVYGLEDEKFYTTQLVGNLARGYIKGGAVATSIKQLLAYYPAGAEIKDANNKWAGVDNSDILFDETRLAELPSLDDLTVKNAQGKITKQYGWAVDATNKYLYYAPIELEGNDKGKVVKAYDNDESVVAARIDGNNVYLVDNRKADLKTEGLAIEKAITETPEVYPTASALKLVGQKVPVKVLQAGAGCYAKVYDQYLVYFIDPLNENPFKSVITLTDIKHDGDIQPIANVTTAYSLKEAFGQKLTIYPLGVTVKNTNPETKKAFTETEVVRNEKLVKWYGITNKGIGQKDAWLINVGLNGEQGIADVKDYNSLNKIKEGDERLYDLELLDADNKPVEVGGDPSAIQKIKFHNLNGDAITKDIVILIPFGFDTKWKQNMTGYITVTIKPNL